MLIMKFQNFHFRNFSPKPCVIIKKIDGEWFKRHHIQFYCFYDSERKIMMMSWFSHFRVMNKNCNAGVYLYNCGYGRTVNDYLGPKSMKCAKIYRDYISRRLERTGQTHVIINPFQPYSRFLLRTFTTMCNMIYVLL